MQVCLVLSRETHTPVPYWVSLPLGELSAWIDAFNALPRPKGVK